jgi:hypothetical protein
MSLFSRGLPRSAVAVLAIAMSAIVVGAVVERDSPALAASGKITICHRTHSTTNPYRRITVNRNAVTSGRHGSHGIPSGSTNPPVYDSSFAYAPNNKFWGDVIPGSTDGGVVYNGSATIALNWSVAGRALFFGPKCVGMTALEFYSSELAAGVAEADIIADLNDQSANEDAALLAALGGAFTSGNVGQWATAVSLTTEAVSSVTSTSAVFHGALTVGNTSTVTGFDYGTDPGLANPVSVAAIPSPVTGSTAVTASVSGLLPGTTYYVRVTGTTNIGTENEGILRGATVSFQTAAANPTTTTTAPETTTTTSTTTTTTAPETSTTTTSTTTTTAPETSTTTTSTTTTSTTTTTAPETTTTSTTVPPSTTTTTSTTVPESTTTAPESSTTSTTVPGSTTTSTTLATAVPGTTTSTTSTSTSTTSVPPTSTTAAPSDPADTIAPVLATGTIEGRVFFDRDRDGVYGSGDIGLANVPVRLWSASDFAGSSAGQAVPAAFGQAPLSVGDGGDLATGAEGVYRFESVSPGAYVVVSKVSLASFHYSFDTDGGEDWIVAVDIQLDQIAQAQFAGVSTEVLTGSVDLASLAGARSLTCWWHGQDGLPGTADDQPLDVPVDAFGNFQVTGAPHGAYACDVGGASVSLASQLPGDVGRSATVSTPVTPVGGVLPQTGGGWSVAPAGAATFAIGGALIVLARRRPRAVS